MKPIRNSARAIIIRDGHLLATRNVTEDDDWYLLPGGGQLPGENLKDTLRRECREEIGATVSVGNLLYVREYIGKNHEFAESDGNAHQVEFMFECEIEPGYEPHNGPTADLFQTGVEWLSIADLDSYRLFPQKLKPLLLRPTTSARHTYMGDVN